MEQDLIWGGKTSMGYKHSQQAAPFLLLIKCIPSAPYAGFRENKIERSLSLTMKQEGALAKRLVKAADSNIWT